MKRKICLNIFIFLFCLLFTFQLFPVTAKADTGPKPSLVITFNGLGERTCYATLLADKESNGPWSVWDGDPENAEISGNIDYDTFLKFAQYEDKDGYYFWKQIWLIEDGDKINWSYYPPNNFKLLLYFPQENSFVISESYSRYAFDSYYKVDLNDIRFSNEGLLPATPVLVKANMTRYYNYAKEIGGLMARVAITILLEMGVAVLFNILQKKQLLLLVGVNTGTQLILNLLLNAVYYLVGGLITLLFAYLLLELLVFVIESVVYCIAMDRLGQTERGKFVYVAYAFLANLTSFVVGLILPSLIPSIF